MSKIIQRKAKITFNKSLVSNYYKLSLKIHELSRLAAPGQFVTLRTKGANGVLLRRPFSIHGLVYDSESRVGRQKKIFKPAGIEILYAVLGKGTEALSRKKPGELIDVLGPLGNGFNYQLPITNCQLPILIGGGMGVAPLLFLAQKFRQCYSLSVKPLSPVGGCHPLVLIGANTRQDILCQKEFENLGCDVRISTDNGSAGFKGNVIDLLKRVLGAGQGKEHAVIYACGPKPMLKAIARVSRQFSVSAQVSLDAYMACGLGVCLGCVVKTSEGNKRVCRDGPVFIAKKVKF